MNKFSIILVGLVAVVCFVSLAAAGDELTNELEEEEDFGPDGGFRKFGSRDVIEEGVENFAEKKDNPCRASKSASACSTCCEATGQAGKYTFEPALTRIKQHRCYCFQRAAIPN